MEVTQDILLPVLLAAIVANTVILLLVVFVGRVGRHERVTPATTRSVLQGSVMSSSFVDHSARTTWGSDGGSNDESAETADTDGDRNGYPAPNRGSDDHAGTAQAETDDSADPDAEVEPEGEPTPEPELVDVTTGKDPLTGLLDPAAFTRLVAAEDLRVHRYHRPATVVIFELGGLDRLIARLGPDAADRVVPALADTMRRLARDVDLVARLAPSRFAILLPETDEVAAINYVERVRRACELWLESGAIALTLAAGWAGTDGDPTLVEAQRLATERMYTELRRDARKAADR
jgi:diguanylate cyclase (GGDEF)-like protein